MLEVDKLVKEFGQIRALDDVSLQVSRGEIVGLLGPNGAGKTTLMNIIAGYIFPSAGYVKIDGLDHVVDSKSACARLGYLPERPPLYDDMTIEDYLAFVVALKCQIDVARKLNYIGFWMNFNFVMSEGGFCAIYQRDISNGWVLPKP